MRIPLLLLAAVPLVSLACATPSILDLKEGTTAETVLEEFGEPFVMKSIEDGQLVYLPVTNLGRAESHWTYLLDNYRDVLLYFEAEELVRWEVVYDQGLRGAYIPYPPDSLCLTPASLNKTSMPFIVSTPGPPRYTRGPTECW